MSFSFTMSLTHGKSLPPSLRKSLYRSTRSTAVIFGLVGSHRILLDQFMTQRKTNAQVSVAQNRC